MTNIEAIRLIKDHMQVHKIGVYPHINLAEALNMAIDALEKQENLEQKKLMYYGTFVDYDGIEDRLILGIDISKKDKSTICVGRNVLDKYEIINQIWDDEAEEIYYKLIGK